MYWVVLAILIIVGWIFYSRRKGTVRLTKDQAELALGLIRKELTEIEIKRQDVIDNAAAKGQTISLEDIFSHVVNEPEPVKSELVKLKKEIFDKYGAKIPIDVAYRLIKQLDPDEKSPWSEKPGCFERHLLRREGNVLFSTERRVVTKKEIKEAQEIDRIEQQQFKEKVNNFITNTRDVLTREEVSLDQSLSILKEVMELIEEAIAIGGNIEGGVERLESIEETLIQSLNKAMPAGAELLEKQRSLSYTQRISYIAQSSRKNSPILKGEEIPALLSEDLETISFVGYMSRTFGPDSKPNEVDIRGNLEKALAQGFSKERASQIIAAWNEKSEAPVM